MSVAVDIVLVAIIVFFTVCAARKGFVNTAVKIAGFIAVILIANPLGAFMSEFVFDHMLSNSIQSKISSAIEGQYDSCAEAIEKSFEALPDFVESLFLKSNTPENVARKITADSDNVTAISTQIVENVVRPVATNLLGVLFMLIIVTIGFILVRILAKIINKAFSFSIIGTLNSALGGVAGLAEGFLIAVLITAVVGALAGMTGGFLGITLETLEKTHLFKLLDGLNPFSL